MNVSSVAPDVATALEDFRMALADLMLAIAAEKSQVQLYRLWRALDPLVAEAEKIQSSCLKRADALIKER